MPYDSSLSDEARKMRERVTIAVRKTILDIEAGAKQRSRVDTGQMRNAWSSEMTGEHEGLVSNSVQHVIFNEYGTRHTPAKPMAVPAADHARPGFVRAVRQALDPGPA